MTAYEIEVKRIDGYLARPNAMSHPEYEQGCRKLCAVVDVIKQFIYIVASCILKPCCVWLSQV